LSDFNEPCFSSEAFEKYSKIKYHANPTSGSPAVPCRQMNEQTDMTKLTVSFHNFVNTPKNSRDR